MNQYLWVVVSLLVVFLPHGSGAAQGVTSLTSATFDRVVKETPRVFVEFYAPWCSHCTKLAPVWKEVAERLEDDRSVVVAQVDGTTDRSLLARFNVTGFPTIKLFVDGVRVYTYTGERSASAMVGYVANGDFGVHKFTLIPSVPTFPQKLMFALEDGVGLAEKQVMNAVKSFDAGRFDDPAYLWVAAIAFVLFVVGLAIPLTLRTVIGAVASRLRTPRPAPARVPVQSSSSSSTTTAATKPPASDGTDASKAEAAPKPETKKDQ